MMVPVVSTVDPDGIIASEQLGQASTDIDQLVPYIEMLHASPALRVDIAQRARSYIERHHAPEPALTAFERTFHDVLGMGAPSA